MQMWRARRQSQTTHKQDQHPEWIAEARGLKIDVHIGNDAHETKEYASDCKQLRERFDLKLQLLSASRSFAWLQPLAEDWITRRTKQDNLILVLNRPIIPNNHQQEVRTWQRIR
jgi:hypothetical protein